MSRSLWARVLAGGALWALVYNLTWGVAWFAFMRQEWLAAVTAIGQSLPFTPRFWIVWVMLTLPFGLAIMAYVLAPERSASAQKAAIAAALACWVPLTVGMAVWSWQESLPVRVIVMDSAVNLAAVLAASVAAQRAVSSPMSLS
jgi:hypothetical protein